MSEFSFRALQEEDLSLLHGWLNQEHLRPFYQRTKVDLDSVVARYRPRLAPSSPTHCHLALLDGHPVGNLQCYRNADHSEYAAVIGTTDGVSVDFFLGQTDLVGRGLGRKMLAAYLNQIVAVLYPDQARVYVCHTMANVRAIRCSHAVGFRHLRDVVEDGAPSVLMVFERAASLDTGAPRRLQSFQVSLKAWILDQDRVLFVRERATGYWEIPGGRIDVGEEHTPQPDVLARELREELGSENCITIGAPIVTWVRQRPEDFVFVVGYLCRYGGGQLQLADEHDTLAWFDVSGLPPSPLAPGYERAFADFRAVHARMRAGL
jgi:aminoglycoside 6'-N-acetyltransferase